MSEMQNADMPLLDRIEAVQQRILNGHALRRIPVDATDGDVVLSDCAKEITRLRAEVEALREEMHSQADVLREVADERDTAIARAEAAEKERDEDRRREYGYSQETVNAIVKERDTLRAELDQLTTWQPIATAPKAKVLLAYRNSQGRWRRVLGRYYEAETLESEHEDSEWAEPGWYEATEAYEYLMPLENDPVLWHPLPDIPTPKETKP